MRTWLVIFRGKLQSSNRANQRNPRLTNGPQWWKKWYLPSGYVKIAIENGHRNSELSHYIKVVIFHSCVSLPEGRLFNHPILQTKKTYSTTFMHKVCECQLVFTGTKAGISERLQGHQLRCDRQVAKGEIHHQHLPHPPGEDDALFGFCHFHLISADRSSCVLSGHFLSAWRSVPVCWLFPRTSPPRRPQHRNMVLVDESLELPGRSFLIPETPTGSWLVVKQPLWKIWKSEGVITIANIWKVIKVMFHKPPTS